VRYAEDQRIRWGATNDFYPHAYRYREWVINAFNRDLPYDQFIRFNWRRTKSTAARMTSSPSFPWPRPKYYNRNRVEVQADEWEDESIRFRARFWASRLRAPVATITS